MQVTIVIVVIAIMLAALVLDKWRPGLVLFAATAMLMCLGIISPKEMLEGFSNKGMITVALLFLVSEGIRQVGALESLFRKCLPSRPSGTGRSLLRILPPISAVSGFFNNTPSVVILSPIIKKWCSDHGLSPSKYLIPVCYATTLGGMCTLIGTSTNLVVHGMMLDSGMSGFSMFELAKIGIPVTILGLAYIVIFSHWLLPERGADPGVDEDGRHISEVVLGPRFPGIGQCVAEYDFFHNFGVRLVELRRGGRSVPMTDKNLRFKEGDTLFLSASREFTDSWKEETRVFLLIADHRDVPVQTSRYKRWLAVALLVLMVTGATVGELPAFREAFPHVHMDMFFFVCLTTVIMAVAKIFPPKNYTKYISWDVLITIACAFGISKAMENSGLADLIASSLVRLSGGLGPHAIVAVLFLVTNIFTEIITNNAAAALSFPIAIEIASHMGIDPTAFLVTVCVAASTSFSTPIGYQSNMVIQSVGNYKFTDFLRFGLPLNIIVFITSIVLIPLIWPF